MPDLTEIIQSSAAHAWLYLPFAALLGALHALEPGHAKSLMAAYIVAIRGTTAQAVTLAVRGGHRTHHRRLGHCRPGLALGERYIVEQAEPWLTFLSGVLIVCSRSGCSGCSGPRASACA
jgi:nickel/cobalt exporter